MHVGVTESSAKEYGVFSPATKATGEWKWPLNSSIYQVKNEWIYNFIPLYAFMSCTETNLPHLDTFAKMNF